ncbi:hypothetical protein H6G81_18570 [Scytonema hofmannii FACHB-248]|uniref:DUF1795 domain-containing protein n=1 Tax=Scytonema hofmannii FACHB-248 TaxID=1842502 RepID=A0ABR8GTC7_9CYAN|nr:MULTISPECIES: hypothetical protein [Nostocales]MBD2606479.1 hypothetical protein [Scytonema hofmannii FACHB-248]
MKSWKLALAILVLGTSFCLPKAQAISLSKTQTSQSESPIILAQVNTISGWKNVSSSTWNFSGILPVEPGIMTMKLDNEYILMEAQLAETDESKYGIFYGQYRMDISQVDPKELLSAFVSEFQDKYKKILETRNITLGRYPGKEYTYQEGQKITKLRVFLAGQRIYVLFVENPAVGDASKFFNAFKIL